MDEYQIVDRVKDRYREGLIKAEYNLLLNDITIISGKSYKRSYEHNPSISKQVIGYVDNYTTEFLSKLEFPTLMDLDSISAVYLRKKGYLIRGISFLGAAPLPNLKYVIYSITKNTGFPGITGHEFKDRLVIELVDLDVVANNLNLPKIVSSVLGPKLLGENEISLDEFYEINDRMLSQKLFAGYTWKDAAKRIVHQYFDSDRRELSKEVFKISEAYQQVIRPYRVVYDTKTWEQVLM